LAFALKMNMHHITSALVKTEIVASTLIVLERHALVVRLRERLGVDPTARAPWDHSDAPGGQPSPDGWELIPKYVGTMSCLMFLEGANPIWKFANGADLLRVLNECPALEFYVCNEEASYLLCSNHHDFVVGWGAAQAWVKNLNLHT
jgi:hypothetical protein